MQKYDKEMSLLTTRFHPNCVFNFYYFTTKIDSKQTYLFILRN